MADIKKELNNIKNAVYGKEVRGSIHDGIKKINDEVENATDLSESAKHQVENIQQQVNQLVVEGDSSVEAAQARVDAEGKSFPTLKARLDEKETQFSSQLAQTMKIEDGELVNVMFPPPPFMGAKEDGTDQTSVIQALLEAFNGIYIDGEFIIDSSGRYKGLQAVSNRKIVFSKTAKLIASESNSTDYRLLNIEGVENVEIINPRVLGDRDYNTSATGEHGHGIYIHNAKNIEIDSPIVKDCWGDGIYVGGYDGTEPENIRINNPISTNNRRQGMSITGVDGINVNNGYFSGTNGTLPSAGLDIEPNYETAKLEGIEFNNCYFEGNEGAGILFYVIKQRIIATFNNCTIKGDHLGFKACSENNGNGDVVFNNLTIIDANINGVRFEGTSIPITIDGLTIIDSNRSGSTTNNGDAILFDTVEGVNKNIVIKGLKIYNDSDLRYPLSFFATGENPNENISVEFDEVYKDKVVFISSNRNNKHIDIKIPYEKRLRSYGGNMDNSYFRDNQYFFSIITNEGISYGTAHTLGTASEFEGHEIGLKVLSPHNLRFIFGGATLADGSTSIASSEVGAEIIIRFEHGKWFIKKQIGEWAKS